MRKASTLIHILSFTLALLFCVQNIYAQGMVSFSTEVSPSSGSLDDDYIFNVIVDGAQNSDYPYLTGGDDFKLALIGPQTSVNIVNGKIDQKIIYRYRLIPKREGKLLTPAAEIEIDGKKYSSEPLTVNVTKSTTISPAVKKDVFLTQTLSKDSVYVGEQVVNTVSFFAAAQVVDPKLGSATYDGFWHESFGSPVTTQKIIDGKSYHVTRLEEALYPIAPGKLTVSPRTIHTKVKVRTATKRRGFDPFSMDPFDSFGSDFFDDFFGHMKLKEIDVTSNEVSLSVRELPTAPADLPIWDRAATIVGQTNIALSYNPGEIKTGESKTVKVEIQSTGNINPLDKITLNLPPNVRVYEDTPELKIAQEGGLLLMKKTFQISLVPMVPGALTVPGIELGYFDPQSASYKIAKSRDISFLVSGESQLQGAVTTDNESSRLNASSGSHEQDPAPKHTPEPKYEEPTWTENLADKVSWSFLALLLFCSFALCLAGYFFARWRSSIRPLREVLQNLSAASTVEELRKSFQSFALFKLRKSGHHLSGEELRAQIRSTVKEPNLQFAVVSLLDELDTYNYGGRQLDFAHLGALRERALEVARNW